MAYVAGDDKRSLARPGEAGDVTRHVRLSDAVSATFWLTRARGVEIATAPLTALNDMTRAEAEIYRTVRSEFVRMAKIRFCSAYSYTGDD